MTGDDGDARTEAERIVRQVEDAVAINATAAAIAQWSAKSPQADMSEHLHATKEASVDRLVAALAAAIEEENAERDYRAEALVQMPEASRRRLKERLAQRLDDARQARRDALSALRARAGEETG